MKILNLTTLLVIACNPGQTVTGGSSMPIFDNENEEDCDSKEFVLECECPAPIINLTCPEPTIQNIIQTECETPVVENIIVTECPDLECPEVTCPSPIVNNNITNTIDTQPIADELAAMTIAMQGGEWTVIPVTPLNGTWEYMTNNDSRVLLVKSIHGPLNNNISGAKIEYAVGTTYVVAKWIYGNWEAGLSIRANMDFPIEPGQTVKVWCNECIVIGQYIEQ